MHPYFEPSRYQYHQVDGWALATPVSDRDDLPKMSGIVKLNIGGVKYETTVGTLVSRGDNFFTTLFSHMFATLKDEEGYYFIDRDGEYFKPLLSYLRTGELRVPPGMSKMCVEREAHFYLIDLNNNSIADGAPPVGTQLAGPPVYHPSPLGCSLARPNARSYFLRYDGVYVQKTRDGEDFFAYYRFFRDGKVSIVTTSRHKVQNKVNNTYEVIEGEWLLIRSNFQRKPTILMGSFGYNSIQIHWRSPRDKKHVDCNTLHFFPSFEPPTDLLFSNQHCRMGKKQYHRLNFKDDHQVTITVMEKDQQHHRLMNSIKRTATYSLEKEEVVTLSINDDFFPEPIISLGTVLLERRVERQVVGQRETCRVYLAVDKHEEEDDDEIDIYTFLRTSSPPVSLNDDDTASSDDDEYRDMYAAATVTNNAPAATNNNNNASGGGGPNARTRSERSLSQ